MKITQGTFSYLPELSDEQIALQLRYALRNGWAIMFEHTDDPHPRNSLWEMWEMPAFDLGEDEVELAMTTMREAREALPERYLKVVCYDSSLGRQTSRLSIIVGRPSHEPGFRLERQEGSNRQIRYSLHSYATDAPAGRRYGASGAGDNGAGAADATLRGNGSGGAGDSEDG